MLPKICFPKTNLMLRQNPNHGHHPNTDHIADIAMLECKVICSKAVDVRRTLLIVLKDRHFLNALRPQFTDKIPYFHAAASLSNLPC